MTGGEAARHLTVAGLQQHWDSGVPVVVALPGDPTLIFRIDGASGVLSLRAPVPGGTAPPANTFAHLRTATVLEAGQHFFEISATDRRLLLDAYRMLVAVADRIQLDGQPPIEAFERTLDTWRSILANRVRIAREVEIGLVGELLTLDALLTGLGAPAVRSWRGPEHEEHDFGLDEFDLEVKTTTAERRRHWVHGLEQLTPTGNRPLWLLSVQITRGGTSGRRLPEILDHVRRAATAVGERAHFDALLASQGFGVEEDADLFPDTWRLRQRPLAFAVGGDFPRLTAERLGRAGIDLAAIPAVTYEVDLTDRAGDQPVPAALSGALNAMEAETNA